MNYATWKLDFSDPNHGTGPEEKISELGFSAEGGWFSSVSAKDSTILGYVSEPLDEAELIAWEFKNLTQSEALQFCKSINIQAAIGSDGKITAPSEF